MAEEDARERDDAPGVDSAGPAAPEEWGGPDRVEAGPEEAAANEDVPGAADAGTPATDEGPTSSSGEQVDAAPGDDGQAPGDEDVDREEPGALDAATTWTPAEGTPARGDEAVRTEAATTEAPTVAVPATEAATTRVPPVAASSVDAPTVQVPPTPAAGTPAPEGADGAESASRRRPLIAVLAAAVVVVIVGVVWLVSGTGTPDSTGASGSGTPAGQPEAAVARIALAPAASATAVAPSAPAEVHVADGRLTDVALTGPDGPVAGVATADGWRSTGQLAYGATYTWSGSAVDSEGRNAPLTGSFTTVDPQQKIAANLNIADDATVGVGAPIIVQFNGDVTDKAAAERALSVRTSVPTEGSWAWLPDTEQGSRAHWRPKEYWKPGTQVDVAADLFGVNTGGGAWGAQDVSSHFTIGRSQIVKADVNSFQMVVVRDGQTVMTLPASYGLGSDPNRNTTNGVHVVMNKQADKLMTNPAYGYFNVPEKWAVRISNNGEFIHANPKSTSAQGNDNVTHGCVNLSTEDAQRYFDTAMFGDPVEVTGSPVPMPRTDIYDWSLTWSEWQSMSALPV